MSVLLSVLIGATAFDQVFDLGVEAYNQRDYSAAIRQFEQLVAQGVAEPEVLYNLGNAYFRSGRLAPAIANYERALHLDPGLEDARENLATCIKLTERNLPKPPPPEWEQGLLFWHFGLRPETALVLAPLCWGLVWVVLGMRQVRRMPYLRRTAAIAALGALAFGASWWAKNHPQQLAVAAGWRVPVHYGRSADETVHFELLEGDRVLIDRRENGWARVETAGGERGWTREDWLVFVGPPYEPPPMVEVDKAPAERFPAFQDDEADPLRTPGYLSAETSVEERL